MVRECIVLSSSVTEDEKENNTHTRMTSNTMWPFNCKHIQAKKNNNNKIIVLNSHLNEMQFLIFEIYMRERCSKKPRFPKTRDINYISKKERKKILAPQVLEVRISLSASSSMCTNRHTHIIPFSIINLKSVPHSVNEKLAI